MITPNPIQTFGIKRLRYTFTLASNAVFAGTNSNQLQVTGLRSQVKIKCAGLPAFPEAEVTIFGLLQQDMIALTATAWNPNAMLRNQVVVDAWTGAGWSTVFAGQIITGGPDYSGIPAVPYRAQCRVLGFESLNPAKPVSYTGPTSVAVIVQNIVTQMSAAPGAPTYTFVNNGVTSTLPSPYFDNTLAEQLRKVKRDSGINIYIEGFQISITPPGVALSVPSFNLSPASGLDGFPALDYQRGYVNVKALYNAAFRFGGPLTISGSQVVTANGSWMIGTLSHDLSEQLPNGPWHSYLLVYPPFTGGTVTPPPLS